MFRLNVGHGVKHVMKNKIVNAIMCTIICCVGDRHENDNCISVNLALTIALCCAPFCIKCKVEPIKTNNPLDSHSPLTLPRKNSPRSGKELTSCLMVF